MANRHEKKFAQRPNQPLKTGLDENESRSLGYQPKADTSKQARSMLLTAYKSCKVTDQQANFVENKHRLDAATHLFTSKSQPGKRLSDFIQLLVDLSLEKCKTGQQLKGIRCAFIYLEDYSLNLVWYPWKPHIKKIKTYSSFLKMYIEPFVKNYTEIFSRLGYRPRTGTAYPQDELTIDKLPDRNVLLEVAFDCYCAHKELDIYILIFNQIESDGYTVGDVHTCRKICSGDVKSSLEWIELNCMPKHTERRSTNRNSNLTTNKDGDVIWKAAVSKNLSVGSMEKTHVAAPSEPARRTQSTVGADHVEKLFPSLEPEKAQRLRLFSEEAAKISGSASLQIYPDSRNVSKTTPVAPPRGSSAISKQASQHSGHAYDFTSMPPAIISQPPETAKADSQEAFREGTLEEHVSESLREVESAAAATRAENVNKARGAQNRSSLDEWSDVYRAMESYGERYTDPGGRGDILKGDTLAPRDSNSEDFPPPPTKDDLRNVQKGRQTNAAPQPSGSKPQTPTSAPGKSVTSQQTRTDTTTSARPRLSPYQQAKQDESGARSLQPTDISSSGYASGVTVHPSHTKQQALSQSSTGLQTHKDTISPYRHAMHSPDPVPPPSATTTSRDSDVPSTFLSSGVNLKSVSGMPRIDESYSNSASMPYMPASEAERQRLRSVGANTKDRRSQHGQSSGFSTFFSSSSTRPIELSSSLAPRDITDFGDDRLNGAVGTSRHESEDDDYVRLNVQHLPKNRTTAPVVQPKAQPSFERNFQDTTQRLFQADSSQSLVENRHSNEASSVTTPQQIVRPRTSHATSSSVENQNVSGRFRSHDPSLTASTSAREGVRPAQPSSGRAMGISTSLQEFPASSVREWACAQCRNINEPLAARCKACSTPRLLLSFDGSRGSSGARDVGAGRPGSVERSGGMGGGAVGSHGSGSGVSGKGFQGRGESVGGSKGEGGVASRAEVQCPRCTAFTSADKETCEVCFSTRKLYSADA